jgi:hypothetical protein
VADFYTVVHRDVGPLATFASYDEALLELGRVFLNEPSWLRDLSIEPFELVVADIADEAERT